MFLYATFMCEIKTEQTKTDGISCARQSHAVCLIAPQKFQLLLILTIGLGKGELGTWIVCCDMHVWHAMRIYRFVRFLLITSQSNMKHNIHRLSRQANPLESSHTFRSAPMSSSIMRSILHQPQAQGKQRKTRNCSKTALLASSRPGRLTRIWVTRDVYLRWCCLCRAVIGWGWNCVRLLSCCFVFSLFVVLLTFVFWVDRA